MSKRRNHDPGFKVRVALEAVKGERAVSEYAAEYGAHPAMIHQWSEPIIRHWFKDNGERAARRGVGYLRTRREVIGRV